MQSEHNFFNNLKPSLTSSSLILIGKYTNEMFLGSLLLKQDGREDQQKNSLLGLSGAKIHTVNL